METVEHITIGDLVALVVAIAGLIGAGGAISNFFVKTFRKMLKAELEPVQNEIKTIKEKQLEETLANSKNFLVQTISKLERGEELDKIELERFWENYDDYLANGGNSYIHSAVENLKKKGKL